MERAAKCLLPFVLVAIGCSATPGQDMAPGKDGAGTEAETRGETEGDSVGDAESQTDWEVALDIAATSDAASDLIDVPSPPDGDSDGEADVSDVATPEVLALPPCAQASCDACSTCALDPVCVNGKNYDKPCAAICDQQLTTWPGTAVVTPGACPACPACQGVVVTCDGGKCQHCQAGGCETLGAACQNDGDCVGVTSVCAQLADGTKKTLKLPCEASCLALAGTAPTKGACKSPCAYQAGCATELQQPVCSVTDGMTYLSLCHMQHCDVQGCNPEGTSGPSLQCNPGQMQLACEGACFADTETTGCPDVCAPVCSIVAGKATTWRNLCIAQAKGGSVGSCAGLVQAGQTCSAALFDTTHGCCPGVDYSNVTPVCAAQLLAGGSKQVQFRNFDEYKCRTQDDTNWIFLAHAPCL